MNTKINTNKLEKLSFTITEDWINFRLDKLCAWLQPQWTKLFICKLINNKDIKVNSKRTTINYKVQLNDIISYYGLPKEKQPINITKPLPALDIIYEDENVIIVNKPPRIEIESSNPKRTDSMNQRLLQHLKYNEEQWKPVFVHRLDTNTTGLLMGAKNYATYCQLFSIFKDQYIKKEYLALVFGKPNFQTTEIKNYLSKKDNFVYISDKNKNYSKFAHTKLKLLHQFKDYALIHATLKTGRTHQIRVHLSSLNLPICGDRKYSKHPLNKQFPYQALTCYKLSIFPEYCKKKLSNLKNQEFTINEPWFIKKINN